MAHIVFMENYKTYNILMGDECVGSGIGLKKTDYKYDCISGFEWPILKVDSYLFNRVTEYKFDLEKQTFETSDRHEDRGFGEDN